MPVKIDCSDLSLDGQRYMYVALSNNAYILTAKDDGSIAIVDLEGIPVSDEIGSILTQALTRRYPPTWYLYIAKRKTMEKYKIGISRNPQKRAAALGVELIHTVKCANETTAVEIEMRLHTALKHLERQISGECFYIKKEISIIFSVVMIISMFLNCVTGLPKVI